MVTEKYCPACKITKPADQFNKRIALKDGLASWCRSCSNACGTKYRNSDKGKKKMKEWENNNKEKIREYHKKSHRKYPERNKNSHYKRTYGVTLEQVNGFLAAQKGGCAICAAKEPGNSATSWHVDHDHKTKHIRGILCFACNLMLGNSKENIDTLMGGAVYLSYHKGWDLNISQWGAFPPGGLKMAENCRMVNGK